MTLHKFKFFLQALPTVLTNCTHKPLRPLATALLIGLLTVGVSACGDIETGPPKTNPKYDSKARKNQQESIFGSGGLFNFDSAKSSGGSGSGIGVNSFLWRASLDTISFMPIASADPFGGVIITDWYSPPESPDERLKVNIFILGTELRSDGIRATVFRQELEEKSEGMAIWRDVAVAPETVLKLENAILDKARELRTKQALEIDD